MPPQFSKWRAIFASIYLKALYRDVWLRWEGTGFAYLWRLNVLLITPAIALAIMLFDRALFDETSPANIALWAVADEVASQIPAMTWHKGTMKTKAKQPYYITLKAEGEGEDEVLAVIDRDATLEDFASSQASLLLTKDAIHLKTDEGVESRFWTEFGSDDFALDADGAAGLLKQLRGWLKEHRMALYLWGGLSLWGSAMVMMTLYRMVQALLYGLVAVMMGAILRCRLRYDVAVRLAAVAITPAILVDIALVLLIGGGISWFMSMALTVGYLYIAISDNRDLSTPSVTG